VKTTIINTVKVIAVVYIIICVLLYFFQEKLIFFPEKLTKDHTFQFNQKFEELNFKTADDKLLNGILFKSDSSKGLIFYLHGNAGSIKSWGEIAQTYTSLNYDLFMLDYRGYGKSEGDISSEKQFYNDAELAYDILKKKYAEDKIIILGYSIGTGPATKLASTNNAKLLILQAPYYSLTDMMHHNYPFVPKFILKYKFETNKFIKECKMPVVIFHGNIDEVIYYGSSLKLKALFKGSDTLITLNGQGHNGISENLIYQTALQAILSR
jgi:uncharacterized protein